MIRILISVSCVVCLIATNFLSSAFGQGAENNPATAASLLGIPQSPNGIYDSFVNRSGNHPGLERKPPLKSISDPANLVSGNPAIEAAAEIKAAMEATDQKVKAIKLLGSVGCGCYQDMVDVGDALLDGMSDCVEKVRFESVVALCQTAGSACDRCSTSCCNAEIMGKLHKMAYGTGADGCSLESSQRVRAAAVIALRACRNRAIGPIPADGPVEGGPRAAVQGSGSNVREASYGMSRAEEDALEFFSSQQISEESGLFRLSSLQDPTTDQPVIPEIPSPDWLAASDLPIGIRRNMSPEQIFSLAERMVDTGGGPAEAVVAAEEKTLPALNTTELLQSSDSVQTVKSRRRAAMSFDPHVRGYQAGQIYTLTNGGFWMSARRDLDSMLGKIDPGMIQDLIVIPGPYGLRYGPGFAFFDIERRPTPRHCYGHETAFHMPAGIRTNGGQLYGRATVEGGGAAYGYRFSYGNRKGSDYMAGNGQRIPSSYNNQDLLSEFSYDLAPHTRLDVSYQRLDQGDTEYAAQFFDIGALTTDGFEIRLIDDNPAACWTQLEVSTWLNRTAYTGNTDNKRNPYFPVIERIEANLDNDHPQYEPYTLAGDTIGGLTSTGARGAVVFGDMDETHLRVGADIRCLEQKIDEDFSIDVDPISGPPDPMTFRTNQPRSWMTDPGVYFEISRPVTDWWTADVGARLDFVATRALAADLRSNSSLPGGDRDLEQNDTLHAFYLKNELELSDHCTMRASFGYAERPPTLTERYADSLFLSLMQSGFTRMIGDPKLKPEENWQIDLGLTVRHENWRARAGAFHAWIHDYVTFQDDQVVNLPDARLLYFHATPLATLAGFEASGEIDLADHLSTFARLSYTEGQDQSLGAPLPAMSPLESTLGVRLHDAEGGRLWQVEFGTRLVAKQRRLGVINLLGQPDEVEHATPGFDVWHLRGYLNRTENLTLTAGVENLFDENYLEHLDLRLYGPTGIGYSAPSTLVLSPGITPYFGLNWTF